MSQLFILRKTPSEMFTLFTFHCFGFSSLSGQQALGAHEGFWVHLMRHGWSAVGPVVAWPLWRWLRNERVSSPCCRRRRPTGCTKTTTSTALIQIQGRFESIFCAYWLWCKSVLWSVVSVCASIHPSMAKTLALTLANASVSKNCQTVIVTWLRFIRVHACFLTTLTFHHGHRVSR